MALKVTFVIWQQDRRRGLWKMQLDFAEEIIFPVVLNLQVLRKPMTIWKRHALR